MSKRNIFLIILFMFSSGKALAQDLEVILDHPVQVFQPGLEGMGEPIEVPANTPVKVKKDSFYWIQSKGRVPALVLPQTTSADKSKMRLSLPDTVDWPPEKVQREVDDKLSILLTELNTFEEAIRRKDLSSAERALGRMDSLGRIEYLHFLRASFLFLRGDIQGAKESTKRGLRRFPANEQGQRFLDTLNRVGGDQ